MANTRVFVVLLRRPRKSHPNERRDDPFYEFGSFGCTRCHSKNLLHPRHARELHGARLAFVQGGQLGFRMIFLTPPIAVNVWRFNCEATWRPTEMPFKYTEAPIVAYNSGRSDFPLVEKFAHGTNRATVEAGRSSRFRSRAQPLPSKMAKQVVEVYERLRATAPLSSMAIAYDDALPYPPPKIDRNRKGTYERHICELERENRRHPCASHVRSHRRVVIASRRPAGCSTLSRGKCP